MTQGACSTSWEAVPRRMVMIRIGRPEGRGLRAFGSRLTSERPRAGVALHAAVLGWRCP